MDASRRWVATRLAVAMIAAPFAADAQQSRRVARIGFLTGSPKAAYESGDRRRYRKAFTDRLRELGWTEGQNVTIVARYAEGNYDHLPRLASELVRLGVDVIFANSAPCALAAKNATTSIPIVFETLGDPISAGLVTSLARPGGNLTGISGLGPELSGKRLELLKELLPGLRRVALVINPANIMAAPTVQETERAAKVLGLTIHTVAVHDSDQLESALGRLASDGVGAVVVVPDPMLLTHGRRIQAALVRHRLPAVHAETAWLNAGALMLFGSSLLDHFRQAATLVDKILRGASPGEVPIEQSTRFELIINLKTAKTLGLTIPPSLLLRADHVIE